MTTLKAQVIEEILRKEGGYVRDPSDSGGETNHGITKQVARAYGYRGRMIDMPKSLAVSIYSNKYWLSVKANHIEKISPRIAYEVVDTAVNMGVVRASGFLQRVINSLGANTISVDGVIGHVTISELNLLVAKRGEDVVLKALNCLQGAFYIGLTERRPKDKRFVYGWLKNRVKL